MPPLPAFEDVSIGKSSGMTRRQWLTACSAIGLPWAAMAQQGTASEIGSLPLLEGSAPDGASVRLVDLRGQVVLVFYWATTCAVCRDKMGELRANLAGWRAQPFTVLGVNLDTRVRDFLAYEALVTQTVPVTHRFTSISGQAAGFRDSMGRPEHLPSACLIDKQGRLVERYSGRIPASTWDRIADLL